MRRELEVIKQAIDSRELPIVSDGLLEPLWNEDRTKLQAQETYLLDYKETISEKFADGYGLGIARLCLAFHNTFGGIILFGVKDRELTISGVSTPFDIESLNRFLTDCSGLNAELVARTYTLESGENVRNIVALLVPRRGLKPPIRLTRPVGKYKVGTLWVRDRAEVLEVQPKHLPLVYSSRNNFLSENTEDNPVQVHRSLPPSPATLNIFVGRDRLLSALWDWLIFGDQPRLYLHGPGGSGKSTLAFEFARLLTEAGQPILFPAGMRLDYVIYISGKETELNPYTAREQTFKLQQFADAAEQYAQIVFHSGLLSSEAIEKANEAEIETMLDELFDNFSGLVVIDDIDALHRRGKESGEETLLMKAFQRRGRTRILYTLRFPPANAGKSAQPVPGLEGDEFYIFTEACCRQFQVMPPDGQHYPKLMEITKSLPLVIETIVLSRKDCGSYPDAFAMFQSKGGDETRRYLYQREYDRLDKGGKSRQVLASLVLFGEPIAFSVICNLFQFPAEHVRDALVECSSVFISTADDMERGETLYQLAPPCVPFIIQVSEGLSYINRLKAAVDHFKKVRVRASPEEAALIVSMDKLIRQGRYPEMISLGKSLPSDDPILVNPKIQSLLGQANAESGPASRETARTFFRGAEGLNYFDVFMMRRWYNLEIASGHGLIEAERICNLVLSEDNLSSRVRSEFKSKLARCLNQQAIDLTFVNRDKTISLLHRSISEYLDALWFGEKGQDIDLGQTLVWLEKPLQRFMSLAHEDPEHVFVFLEQLAEKKRDVHEAGLRLYRDYLLQSPLDVRRPDVRNKVRGLCMRTHRKLSQILKSGARLPSLQLALSRLEDIRVALETIEGAARS